MKYLPNGKEYTIHQACNDWITVQENAAFVCSPLHVQLTPDEVAMMRELDRNGQVGHMFTLFELSDDGRFTRRRN